MSHSGFVYILSNESMPGILKVGATTKHPEDRAKELFSTGVAVPFHVEFAIHCCDAFGVERFAHDSLSTQRVSSSREFFRVDLSYAIEVVLQHADIANGEIVCVNWYQAIHADDVNRLAFISGGEPYDVVQILNFVEPDHLRLAYEKLERHRSLRRSQLETARIG